jgi:protein-S-isoprenylcysteine O-methyltransferase Ste14
MNTLIPPPVLVLLFGAMMVFLDRFLALGRVLWAWRLPLSVLLLCTGLLLMVLAVVHFFKVKTTINPLRPSNASTLVTTGVFSLSRNPIYLGDLLVLIALGVWLGNLFNLGTLALFVVYLNRFQITPEEQALSKLFGAGFSDYCLRVRRWI